MEFQVVLQTHCFYFLYIIKIVTASSTPISRVFKAYQLSFCFMNIVRIYRFEDLSGCDSSIISFNRFYLATGVKSNTAAFINIYMAHFFTYYFSSGLGMAFDGNLIGHGSAWAK